MSETVGKETGYLLEPPAEKNFAAHLRWHLYINGTRPEGRPGAPGSIWETKKFVEAIDQARGKRVKQRNRNEEPVRGDVAKNLRNWLNGRYCYPYWLNLLEEVLFGDNPLYAEWRARLRNAHETTREGRTSDSRSDIDSEWPTDNAAREKLQSILETLSAQIDQIKRQGVTEAALRAIVIRIETQMQDAPIGEILHCIETFIKGAVQEEQKRRKQSKEVPDLTTLRKAARDLLDAGQLNEVSSPFDRALLKRHNLQEERIVEDTRLDIQLLIEAADYDHLAFNIEMAAGRYFQIATLLHPGNVSEQMTYLNDQGQKFLDSGIYGGDQASLLIAICLFRELSEAVDRTLSPNEWAMTKYSLGLALLRQGEREAGSVRLDEAIVCFRQALEECSKDPDRFNWALTQCDLGDALSCRGERETGTKTLHQAIDCLRQALTVLTRDNDATVWAWATAQNNLGNALSRLGSRTKKPLYLKDAVEAYRAALYERTPERQPKNWAMTANNLSNTLFSLAELQNETAPLEEAIHTLQELLKKNSRENEPARWATAQVTLGNALTLLGKRQGNKAILEEAVLAFRNSLTVFRREREPRHWSIAQHDLGMVLAELGNKDSGIICLEQAIEAFQQGLTANSPDETPSYWANTQIALGDALYKLALRSGNVIHAERSAAIFDAVWARISFLRTPRKWISVLRNYALVHNLVVRMKKKQDISDA
jgi:tetratricopeptide (TPR) repeat protein